MLQTRDRTKVILMLQLYRMDAQRGPDHWDPDGCGNDFESLSHLVTIRMFDHV